MPRASSASRWRARPAGSTLHAVADEGVPIRDIAEVIGRHLDVPVVSVAPDDAPEHFTWLAGFLGADSPASSALTRELLGWQPTQPGLIDDLDAGHYFDKPSRSSHEVTWSAFRTPMRVRTINPCVRPSSRVPA